MGGPGEQSKRHREGRIELEEVPAQPLLCAAPLLDEIIAVVEQ
jgi:hypothetical protein